ncbi:MAG: transglycosylase SLT domain-containing protein [Bacteroidales bacterium]|nr:transglycosylase SLT domain-containing protein [Bacteroidales bacterium]
MGKFLKYAAAGLALLALFSCRHEPLHDGTPLRCAIISSGTQNTSSLLCGYNYALVQKLAKSEGRDSEIRLAGSRERILDSLKNGSIDLVVLPSAVSFGGDSLLTWHSIDSCGVWIFPASEEHHAHFAWKWMKQLRLHPSFPKFRQSFMDIYDPGKKLSADFISPYDSLFRVYADTLGWDWKLLAALVYQESKFKIEAHSPMGASGLMQLVPHTIRSYDCSNPLDPEENIRSGVKLLMRIKQKFSKHAADSVELTNFTLAAYNAGSTRIREGIALAKIKGVDSSRWENIASVFEEMEFNGEETKGFVRRVRYYHERYRHICP